MADEWKPARTLEPGTIDKVRKNLGHIDDQEALEMQRKLGGEILKERAAPINYDNIPKSRHRQETVIKASGFSSSDVASKSSQFTATSSSTNQMGTVKQIMSKPDSKKLKTDDNLPAVSASDLKKMDKLMRTPEYDIKPDYGVFNFIYRMSQKNREKVTKTFGEYICKRHVEHMQAFISSIKTFIQLSPDAYKSKIATETELKFKFLRTVGKWTMRDIKVIVLDVENNADNLTVPMLIPFVRAVYHELITIYYIGEQQIPALIKEIYTDLTAYPDSNKDKLQMLAKQVITEWLYIYNQILKGMYPLLMRMCSEEYVEFPQFFTQQIAQILQFLNLTKFDLLLPDNKKKKEEEAKKKAEEAKKKAEENRRVPGEKDDIVNMGLKILEQLFPQAGFSHLERHPDMFPYFQPLYGFEDGFNMLNPENPVQVTVVLVRIIEDFFKGCRNIQFNIEADPSLAQIPDKISDALNDWASYHEDLFDKKYGDYLRNYVNAIYSQPDYAQSQLGKENLNNLLWRAKFYFLPNYQFSAPILQKPANDSKYRPLYARTDYIRQVFSTLTRRIDENTIGKKAVLGVMNPWARYQFDLPNIVSKRLDVLLGAKRDENVTAATNANLIKYTLCIVSVLDWWINNPQSPAYASDSKILYRISDVDGAPQFSVPERNDQNTLFAEGIKKAIAAKQKK